MTTMHIRSSSRYDVMNDHGAIEAYHRPMIIVRKRDGQTELFVRDVYGQSSPVWVGDEAEVDQLVAALKQEVD